MANSKRGSIDGIVIQPVHDNTELTTSQEKRKRLDIIEEEIDKESLNETLERDTNLAYRLEREEGVSGKKAPISKDSEKRPMSGLISYKPSETSYSASATRKVRTPLMINVEEEEEVSPRKTAHNVPKARNIHEKKVDKVR